MSDSEVCQNCGSVNAGAYCANCGQNRFELRRPLSSLVGEFLSDSLSLDSKLARTMLVLFTQPAELTRQYCIGRRARFTSPIRLYFFASILFFFATSFMDSKKLTPQVSSTESIKGSKSAVKSEGNDVDHEMNDDEPGTEEDAVAKPNDFRVSLDVPDGGTVSLKEQVAKLRAQAEQEPSFQNRFQLRAAERFEGFVSASSAVQNDLLGHAIQFLKDTFPKLLIVLMPVFALLLKLFFLKSKRFYAEHLVFALHLHVIAFFALLPAVFISSEVVVILVCLFLMVYGLIAVRRMYGQSWLMTVFKSASLGCSYVFILGFGAALVFVAGFLV